MKLLCLEPAELDLSVSEDALRAQGVELIDSTSVIDYVDERFCFSDGLFDDLIFIQTNKKLIRAVSRPFALPSGPAMDRMGIDFLRIDMATPRMTTSASMTWARHARSNVVDTTRSQCIAFLQRSPVVLDDQQLQRCSGRGFVLIRHDGHGLGVGFLESTRNDDARGRIRSMYPRAYSADIENTTPFGNPS